MACRTSLSQTNGETAKAGLSGAAGGGAGETGVGEAEMAGTGETGNIEVDVDAA